ncbi:hypothetical protein [Mycobacterium asiaticum]|uniref:DUF4062 domain-containing protein n=1 Tax=Mycobacterium asiaticum TaxID=1790 RepID=A0A1A3CR63_MYCAS|nr:hypothetical protein [Mycobacterium asiaticum]OBI89273.1 hypothetical protein A9X01_13920 [Mycobacterium asiaticum]
MGFAANVLKVMISSPGDTADEVEAVKSALQGWNGSRAENAQTVLLPRFWKTDAVPQMDANGGQGVINSQLVDDADIVLALFDSRLGQATDSAVSGTAEEIERAAASGKPVHVWFSDEPVDRNADLKELDRLRKFRKELEDKGLLGVYADLNDLAYKVREAIESDISCSGLGAPSVVRKGEHAMPRVRVEKRREQSGVDRRGAPKFTTHSTLVLENKSQHVTAEQLTMDPGVELRGLLHRESTAAIDMPPLSELRFPLMLHMGLSDHVTVELNWFENDEEQHVSQPVSLF